MHKAKGISFLNDSQYLGVTMPAPNTYSPMKDVILKRVTGQVRFDSMPENIKKMQQLRAQMGFRRNI